MADDGTMTLDLKINTSDYEKALNDFKNNLGNTATLVSSTLTNISMAVSLASASFQKNQNAINRKFEYTNELIKTQTQLMKELDIEFGMNAVIAQQLFVAQSEITRVMMQNMYLDINTLLIPALNKILEWVLTNMPIIDALVWASLLGIKDTLDGIGMSIKKSVVPQLNALLKWAQSNSTKMTKAFNAAFNGPKKSVDSLKSSYASLNSQISKYIELINKLSKLKVTKIKSTTSSRSTNSSSLYGQLKSMGVMSSRSSSSRSSSRSSSSGSNGAKWNDYVGDAITVTSPFLALVPGAGPLMAATAAVGGQIVKYSDEVGGKIVDFVSQLKRDDQKLDDAVRKGLFGNLLKGYAIGTPYLPNDMIALVHEGEMIVPKSQNPYAGANRIKAAMNATNADTAASNVTNNITYTFNSPKALGMSDILKEMRLAEQRKTLLGV